MVSFEAYLRALPASDDPRAFGLHPHASIALNRQEGRRILDAVMSLQPRVAEAATAVASVPTAAGGQQQQSHASGLGPAAGVAAAAGGGAAAKQFAEEGALAAQVDEMLRGLPAPLDRARASALRDPFAPLPGGGVNALATVLTQEMGRWVAGGFTGSAKTWLPHLSKELLASFAC